jgi:hypothetical protein
MNVLSSFGHAGRCDFTSVSDIRGGVCVSEFLRVPPTSDPRVTQTKRAESGRARKLFNLLKDLEAAIGIEPMNKGFADLCLTTWLRRPGRDYEGLRRKDEVNTSGESVAFILHPSAFILTFWSGRRDLNSRPSPWQGDALPLSYSRF